MPQPIFQAAQAFELGIVDPAGQPVGQPGNGVSVVLETAVGGANPVPGQNRRHPILLGGLDVAGPQVVAHGPDLTTENTQQTIGVPLVCRHRRREIFFGHTHHRLRSAGDRIAADLLSRRVFGGLTGHETHEFVGSIRQRGRHSSARGWAQSLDLGNDRVIGIDEIDLPRLA
ncbi:Uncharacterised protein [Mycobacteroides abscessus subsp. abscessus]|nr:Uncharacterised protein [Mycobacteroides abscessus subsp. abscessus]